MTIRWVEARDAAARQTWHIAVRGEDVVTYFIETDSIFEVIPEEHAKMIADARIQWLGLQGIEDAA